MVTVRTLRTVMTPTRLGVKVKKARSLESLERSRTEASQAARLRRHRTSQHGTADPPRRVKSEKRQKSLRRNGGKRRST